MNKRALLGLVVGGLLVTGFLLVLMARQNLSPQEGAPQLSAVASFYPLYFFTTELAGNRWNISNLVPAGLEPHDYEPPSQEWARVEKSQLLILNGAGLEPWQAEAEANFQTTGPALLVLSPQSVTDPHRWLSPLLAREMVAKIASSLARLDPAHALDYEARAASLDQKLVELDQDYRAGLSHCAQSEIVTMHAAFGYLASAYNFRQTSLAGLAPEAEPSPAQLASLVALIRQDQLHYIFSETSLNPALAQTLAQETGAQILVLNPLESLTAAEQAAGDNYFTVMRSNLDKLKLALQCSN